MNRGKILGTLLLVAIAALIYGNLAFPTEMHASHSGHFEVTLLEK